MFDITVEQHRHEGTNKLYYQVSLSRDQAEWKRRRRYHGFVLLVGHPDIPLSAAELAKLYRAKDVIERDFRLIKDVVELRPIYHHTNAKVRAHVTLCVLALLLQRVLESRLAAAGSPHDRGRMFGDPGDVPPQPLRAQRTAGIRLLSHAALARADGDPAGTRPHLIDPPSGARDPITPRQLPA